MCENPEDVARLSDTFQLPATATTVMGVNFIFIQSFFILFLSSFEDFMYKADIYVKELYDPLL